MNNFLGVRFSIVEHYTRDVIPSEAREPPKQLFYCAQKRVLVVECPQSNLMRQNMAEATSTEVFPLDRVPVRLFANILRFTDFDTQKAFSETCKLFNKWSYLCSKEMYEADRPRRDTQQEIMALLNKKIKARDPREQRKIDKEIQQLTRGISAETQIYVNTHSTLFARTFVQTVEENPSRFLQKGKPSKKVIDVFYWMPEKVIKAIDAELSNPYFKRVLGLIEVHQAGKLAEFVAENREDFEEAYKQDAEKAKLLEDEDTNSSMSESENSVELDSSLSAEDSTELHTTVEIEVDDKALYNFALNIVEVNIRDGLLKKQQELLELKDEFLKKVSAKSPGSIQLEEPEINSGPSFPR